MYRLTALDAEVINRRRTTAQSIAQRMKMEVPYISDSMEKRPPVHAWPEGAQAHIGNRVQEGESYPMLIVRVWGTGPESKVNGQVHLDGNDVLWVASIHVGIEPGTYQWPARTT
jgi:hypothetical protein